MTDPYPIDKQSDHDNGMVYINPQSQDLPVLAGL